MADDIVLLATASSEVEAGMWNDALQAEKIRTLIRPGGPGAGAWASAATFEHNVFVRASDLARARTILEGAIQGSPPLPRARLRSPRVNRATVTRRS